ELVFDPVAPAERGRELARRAAAQREGVLSYDSYSRESAVEEEIAAVATAFADPALEDGERAIALGRFHARANPGAMWGMLVDSEPGPMRDRLVQLLVVEGVAEQ